MTTVRFAADGFDEKQASSNNALKNKAVLQFVPSCQCCGRNDILCTSGVMSHHGFDRPGDGYIHGECDGGRQLPYEVSKDVLVWLLPEMQNQVVRLRRDLEAAKQAVTDIEAGKPFTAFLNKPGRDGSFADHLPVEDAWNVVTIHDMTGETFEALKSANPEAAWSLKDHQGRWDTEAQRYVYGVVPVTFEELHNSARFRAEQHVRRVAKWLRSTESAIPYLEKRIANWTPLMTIPEFYARIGRKMPKWVAQIGEAA